MISEVGGIQYLLFAITLGVRRQRSRSQPLSSESHPTHITSGCGKVKRRYQDVIHDFYLETKC